MGTEINVLDKTPMELLEWLMGEFELPELFAIETMEDMKIASKNLITLSGYYSYLATLLSYAKIKTRELKRKKDKLAYEDMVDKKEVIQNMLDSVKQMYNAISRAVTIYIENQKELNMNRSI